MNRSTISTRDRFFHFFDSVDFNFSKKLICSIFFFFNNSFFSVRRDKIGNIINTNVNKLLMMNQNDDSQRGSGKR